MITIERKPTPSASELAGAVHALSRKGFSWARPHDLDARDPAFIDALLPLLDWFYDSYFRCETELACEIPPGPLLVVGNHNGMSGVPDMFCHMTAFWRRYGSAEPAYGLMHDVPFRVPAVGAWLNGCGALAARPENALAALDRGARVLVFPGGDIGACKPTSKQYKIQLAGRRGFLKVALRRQIPIMPLVSAGGHQSLYLWADGQRIARALRLPQLVRSNVFPIGFALPYGFIVGTPFPHLPPPVKIHTRVLAPMQLDLPPSAADDPEALDWAYTQVVATMQSALDELRREQRHGLFPAT